MHAFQSDRPRCGASIAATLIAASIALTPAAVSGQTGQPLGPPIPLVPPALSPSAASPDRSPPTSILDTAVASEPLPPISPDWGGDAAPLPDPLPRTFWSGTPRAIAELLLAELPDTSSPALHSLGRRLLLSPATPPEGQDEGGRHLPVLRARGLLRLGELAAARAVIAAIPENERGPALPLAVAAYAIGGEVDEACATVREAIRHDQNSFWQTALIACQGLQGETDRASLGLQLLAEEQGPHNEALSIAVDALAGRSAPPSVDRTEGLDPLTLRLLIAARRSLAPQMIESMSPDLALCLAVDQDAPAVIRVLAAERAARFGAVAADRLGEIYSATANAEEPGSSPALDRAQRYAAIERAATPTERLVRIISFADALGALQPGGFALASRLVLPALREIEPAPSAAGSAPVVTRLLIAAGDNRTAIRWGALASGNQSRSLRLLLGLTREHGAAPVEIAAEQDGPLLIALYSALGAAIAPGDWIRLPRTSWIGAGPPSPPPAALLRLAEAARAKRIGETALAAAIVAAPTGALSTDPVALFTVISALRQVGLEADAHRFAIEAALADNL